MSIKIFLPEELFYAKKDLKIYGEVKVNDLRGISHFVVGAIDDLKSDLETEAEASMANYYRSKLRHLGVLVNDLMASDHCHNSEVALRFVYTSGLPNIYLQKLNIQFETEAEACVNIILYREEALLQLQDLKAEMGSRLSNSIGDNDDDIKLLVRFLKQKQLFEHRYRHSKGERHKKINELCKIITSSIFPSINYRHIFIPLRRISKPLISLAQYSTLYEHYREWSKFKCSKQRSYNLALDKFLGLVVMLLFLVVINKPEEYLISASHFIVLNLRNLLNSLRGSPIGIKLNGQLNDFLLNCFGYHVDLWSKFLDLMEPIVGQLFLPASFLGLMGMSFQLSVLTDLISLVSLHAHCFSIYTAVLYKMEINGLSALWKMMLGKRWNVLKNRVESHNYNNRQLYLGTMFFTTLLFLFPTILTYYIVFTTVRLCIGLLTNTLNLMRQFLLNFPLEMFLNWFGRRFYERNGLEVQQIQFEPAPPSAKTIQMFVFRIHAAHASLGRIFEYGSDSMDALKDGNSNSFREIFHKILTGRF